MAFSSSPIFHRLTIDRRRVPQTDAKSRKSANYLGIKAWAGCAILIQVIIFDIVKPSQSHERTGID